MNYQDIVYKEVNGVATITINRPEKLNAFRGQTCEELIHAFNLAGWKKEIRLSYSPEQVIGRFALVGINLHMKGSYDGRGTIGLPIEELQSLIRDVPKPVIARVKDMLLVAVMF